MTKTDKSGIFKMAKQLDTGAVLPPKKPVDLEGKITALQKTTSRQGAMIHALYVHLSKKDRLAFAKRFYI